MDNAGILRLVYTFFLGLLLAIFIGVGINTFYPPPAIPEYPTELSTYGGEFSETQKNVDKEYQDALESYNESSKPYNRNVSIIGLASAVLLLAISIFIEKKITTIDDGVMLGGLFTLIYSLGRGFAAGDDKFSFIAITVGLVSVLYLGYHRFVATSTAKTKPRKRAK